VQIKLWVLVPSVHVYLTYCLLSLQSQGAAKVEHLPDCLELNFKAQLKRIKPAAAAIPPAPASAHLQSTDIALQALQLLPQLLLPYALQNASTTDFPQVHIPTKITPRRRHQIEEAERQSGDHLEGYSRVSSSPSHPSTSTTKCTLDSLSPQPAASSQIDYPPLSDWLTQLNSDAIHGCDQQNYAHYSSVFDQQGLLHLDDLSGMKES
jgi:hypothetical protein